MSASPRIIVFAYSELGHACLQYLLEHKHNVVAVYTHEDNPNEKIWFGSVAQLARHAKIPVFTHEKLSDAKVFAELKAQVPDLIFSFYYRNMIPKAVLELPKLGAYNMHGSHLPKFRGRAPVNWAVLHGETQTGATLHVMVEKADAGDIVDQEAVPIGPDDTTAQVQARVTEAAVKVLARQIGNLEAGKAPRTVQDEKRASYFGRRTAEDGRINWQSPAATVHNLVRAVTHPFPGAFADIGGVKTYIWASRRVSGSFPAVPAGHFHWDNGRLLAGCADQPVELLSLQSEGEEEMRASDWFKKHQGQLK